MSGWGGHDQGYGGGYGGGYPGGYQPPPPQQGYNQYPPQQQHGYDQYGPPGGPPPPQQHGYGQYGPPGGPPPHQQGYQQQGYNQYPPQGGPPPSHHQGSNRFPAPSHPPPQGLDQYGYPLNGPPVQGYGGQHRAGPPPPSAPQGFGHGAPDGYTFQYSNCTGKRKALLIGINYFGQDGELRGCINDTKNVSVFLMERYGYKREDMIILTDDQRDPIMQPTKANIIRAMEWLVSGARPNDSLFLHYSGHGGQTEDTDGDEEDGSDEVIYPVDYKQAGHIVDDQLHDVVVRPLVAGVRLTAIFDSCHSGSVLDLPYIYSTKGVLKEPNLAAEAGQGLLSAFSSYAKGDTAGVAKAIFGFAKTAYRGDDGYKKTIKTKTSPADVIMWSGSKDDQTSADATIASQATGAMSWAFITAIKQDPKQSYVELLNSIRDVLQTKYSQKPQLSCSHPLEDPSVSVLVVEYGYLDNNQTVLIPYFAGSNNFRDLYDITSTPLVHLNNAPAPVFAAATVGGGSVVNGMYFDRASASDCDMWELGNPEWGWDGMLPYFIKSTNLTPPTPEIAARYNYTWNASAWARMVQCTPVSLPSNGRKNRISSLPAIPYPTDGGDGSGVGIFWVPNSQDPTTETRSDARTVYYDPVVNRTNLPLMTATTVNRVLFRGKTAIGIEMRYSGSSRRVCCLLRSRIRVVRVR
ncbi:Uu.00g041560.m01.CDS01 [Anthostomella pinea]|uniref:Uu.00g041560.m01.CDS01 n=1 Tax=Anthostomella pinea TaxID=933095 RepID=A0AAI8YE63_9PEZI|nr:Uu.00g041560.m01.CDS01 [Anthostomella pinea]